LIHRVKSRLSHGSLSPSHTHTTEKRQREETRDTVPGWRSRLGNSLHAFTRVWAKIAHAIRRARQMGRGTRPGTERLCDLRLGTHTVRHTRWLKPRDTRDRESCMWLWVGRKSWLSDKDTRHTHTQNPLLAHRRNNRKQRSRRVAVSLIGVAPEHGA
jgi:hypothetical protein